ncbi:family 43 glycosylhydrolase [Dyadobacter sp. OTU695]|uniref:family 43 glycosylhydrolase n=1 Tax=Dyadobacter sp. OTU695 TaxID=3043860 RepID=UPI00313AA0F7
MRLGRSKALTGPYLDRNGTPMKQGGGTLLLEGNADWHGVGYNTVCTSDGVDYLVFHGYNVKDKGRSKLRVERLEWKDGWPVLRSH